MAENLSLMHQIYSFFFFQFLLGFLCMGISLAQQSMVFGRYTQIAIICFNQR